MKKFGILIVVFLLLCGCVMGVSAMWRQEAVIAGPNDKTDKVLTWPSLFLQKNSGYFDGTEYVEGTHVVTETALNDWFRLFLNGQQVNLNDFLYDLGDYHGLQLKTGDVVLLIVDDKAYKPECNVNETHGCELLIEIMHAGKVITIDDTYIHEMAMGDRSGEIEFTVADSVYISASHTIERA